MMNQNQAGSPEKPLTDVNTTDLKDAVRLGCQVMGSVFNPEDRYAPYFGVTAWPEPSLRFSGSYTDAHVPGRHLNALLNAEDALGITVPEEVIERHAQAAFRSYSGAAPLPLNRRQPGAEVPTRFVIHNVREGFHALCALAKYRNSKPARDLAERSIAAIRQYWDPSGWHREQIEAMGLEFHSSPFIMGLARALGPLVKYHRATGSAPALELARMLAQKITAEFFTADGLYDINRFGSHIHSTTCVMSSLAQLADLDGDAGLIERVKTFYDRGLRELRDDIGWSIECSDIGVYPDRGEGNNTGDILETALILGRRGHAGCWDDAERILRAHLLPSQLRDVSWIPEARNPEGVDGKRNVAARLKGSWGFPAPYGHRPVGQTRIDFNTDIVGGAVGSLCEAWREAVRSDEKGHRVNLLFDRDTEAVRVESPYTGGALRVTVKRPGPLAVRIPGWVPREQVRVENAGAAPVRWEGAWLVADQPGTGATVLIKFPLVEQSLVLHHRTREIRCRLRGDEVVAMDHFGTGFAFFEPL